MRIGVITFHRSVSYGAFLQTYAMCRYLKSMGHEVEVIDYNPVHRDGKVRPWNKRFGGFHPQNVVNIFYYRAFSSYIRRYLPLTSRSYRTLAQLQDDPPAMDAYICGSDQIWNPRHTGLGFDRAYFADFGGSDIKRIAYAPSFGSSDIPEEHKHALRENVSHLDFISVREKSGCDLIRTITGRQCVHVLDPTFLISDYSELYKARDSGKKPYILVFGLQNSPLLQEVLAGAQRADGSSVVFVGNNWRVWKYPGKVCFCTPGEWLTLFANAKAVITNSFHGMAFCLRFRKPFLSVGLQGQLRNRNARVVELLEAIGLSERFLSEDNSRRNEKLIAVDPDWAAVWATLSRMLGDSTGFISKSLSE